MRVSNELKVDLLQATFLTKGRKSILSEVQKKVCCKFETRQVGWNDFTITMNGTENGVKKARNIVLETIEAAFPHRSKVRSPTQKFAHFNRLPFEIKQMIVDRVPCEQAGRTKEDGLGLLNTREASKEMKHMADRTLKKLRKVNKDKIFVAEPYKSGSVRLGTPPFTSKIVVPTNEFDKLLGSIELSGSKEVHIRCEFREDWCDSMMKVLLKHDHIKPEALTIYGVAGKSEIFHEYVAKTPSLKRLIFEKPLVKKAFFKTPFMPFFSNHFVNLGPQDNTPENIRNAYVSRVVFSNAPVDQGLPFGESKF